MEINGIDYSVESRIIDTTWGPETLVIIKNEQGHVVHRAQEPMSRADIVSDFRNSITGEVE